MEREGEGSESELGDRGKERGKEDGALTYLNPDTQELGGGTGGKMEAAWMALSSMPSSFSARGQLTEKRSRPRLE